MDQINAILKTQLSEREVMIFLLVENSGLSNRKLAVALGISHESVRKTHEMAKAKMLKAGDAGYFQTRVVNKEKENVKS